MNVFLLSLIHAGSLANPVPEEGTKSKWEETVDVFRDVVTRIGDAADDATAQIKSSQLSKELE